MQSTIPAGKKPPASESLPSELVFEILIRLSGKPVARCKCVCKDWLVVIGSGQFRKAYRNRSRGLIMYWCEEIAAKFHDPNRRLRFYYSSLRRLNEPPPPDFFPQLDLKINSTYNGVTQLVNGLVCLGYYPSDLADYVKLTLHNVFTGEKMKVPDPQSIFCTGIGTTSTYHLGYSPNTGEYKILRLVFQRDRMNDEVANLPVLAQTIVLRASGSGLGSTWKTINYQGSGLAGLGERSKAFYKMASHHEVRTFPGDGVVCWFRKKEGLILFDFYSEKFWRVKAPKELQHQHEDRVFVRAGFNGHRSVALYVLPQDGEPECFVLDDYDHGIWRKEDVEFPEEIRGRSGDSAVVVADFMLLLMGNQENSSGLVYGYSDDKSVERLRVGNLPNKGKTLDMKGKGPSMDYSLCCSFDARLSFVHDSSLLYRSINDVLTDNSHR